MEHWVKDDFYDYRILPDYLALKENSKNINSLSKSFSDVVRNLDKESNSKWVLRNYLSARLILASSVLLTSADYAVGKNVRIVEPYLYYYSLLNCARAVAFTNPWVNGDDLFTMTHEKTINVVCDHIIKYDKEKGAYIKDFINKAKSFRELYSYRLPTKGIQHFKQSFSEVVEICTVLAELAQLQSAVLERTFNKNGNGHFELDIDIMSKAFYYNDISIFDEEDFYRVNYLARKNPRPLSIINTMTEGWVEDYFGGWCADEDLDMSYNPDQNWRIIFNVP